MEEVLDFLRKIIKENDRVVVAVSGGADSMSLLYLTYLLKQEINIKIICAHVNHNVRKESVNEALSLKKFCEEHDLIFEQMVIQKYHHENFHKEARVIRYKFFEDLVSKYNAKYLFTAHHGDDLVETIMMRLVRGSALSGYAGFSMISKYANYTLVRPLIKHTKLELEQFCHDMKIEYATDLSNFKDVYTRNRYRKYMLPFLKKENEDVHLKFLNFSEDMQEISSYIEEEKEAHLKQILKDDKLDITKFLKLNIVIQKAVIMSILSEYYKDDIDKVNRKHVLLILDMLKSKNSQDKVILPCSYMALKEYNYFYLKKIKETKKIDKVILDRNITLENGHVIKILNECESNGNDVCRLSQETVSFPLYIRTRIDGDKMTVKNMKGHKKIKSIFIDHKIPSDLRDTWPIVVDAKGEIVWLPNLKKSQFDKTNNEKYDIILKYY